MQNRRAFLKQTCSFCAGLAGLGIIASALESCKSTESLKVSVTQNQITVPTKAFGDQKNLLVKDLSLAYEVLVVKYPDGTYGALQLKCTHMPYPLTLTPSGLVCGNHGSEFDFSGNIKHDPAPLPLKKYPCTGQGNKIFVQLA